MNDCTCPFGPEDAHFGDCPMVEDGMYLDLDYSKLRDVGVSRGAIATDDPAPPFPTTYEQR
jgi:hypothetical protein